MGLQVSKAKLVYEVVGHGNVEAIVALHRDGANLEWRNAIHGRTPLMRACRREELWHVAKTLIDLGANVDARQIRSPAGTALHSAAKRGLRHTVGLLLSGGANALLVDDNQKTALDLAREGGHFAVVRAIENHISLFSGWLLEVSVSKQEPRNIWAVVLPCDGMNPAKYKFVVYSKLQVAHPCTILELWKFKIVEPNFNEPDPALVLVDKSKRTRFKFLSTREGDKQQLLELYLACRGTRQTAMNRSDFPAVATATTTPPLIIPSAPPAAEPVPTLACAPVNREWDVAIDASIRSAVAEAEAEGVPPLSAADIISTRGGRDGAAAKMNSQPVRHRDRCHPDSVVRDHHLIIDDDGGGVRERRLHGGGSSSSSFPCCVICLDAPIEGACVPCGHMAGCMTCLDGIQANKCGCPICRVGIQRVVKLYAV